MAKAKPRENRNSQVCQPIFQNFLAAQRYRKGWLVLSGLAFDELTQGDAGHPIQFSRQPQLGEVSI
jgi:hypothetical protein